MKYTYKGTNPTTLFIDTANFKVSQGDIIETKVKLSKEEMNKLGLEVQNEV